MAMGWTPREKEEEDARRQNGGIRKNENRWPLASDCQR